MTTDVDTVDHVRAQVVVLEPRNRAALDIERDTLLADAEVILPDAIPSPAAYTAIAELELRIDHFLARVGPLFDDHCATAHKVWKTACDIRAAFLAGPKDLKARARRLLSDYKAKEDQRRRDEERRIAEEQQRADLIRQKAEAKLLESQGQPELAAAVRAAPVFAPVVVLPSAVPDVAGLSYREDWYWQPVGGDTPTTRARALSMLVRPEYLPFVSLNDAGLTSFAKRTKGTIKIPGIEFHSRQTPVRR